jgi:hypothetical protein
MMRDTVDVGKWIQAGYRSGTNAMNTTMSGDRSFLEQRLGRG